MLVVLRDFRSQSTQRLNFVGKKQSEESLENTSKDSGSKISNVSPEDVASSLTI